MTEEKPSNWDWVTAREKCSIVKMFELLGLEASSNVEVMNSLLADRGSNLWEFVTTNAAFSVSRREFTGLVGVRFALRGNQIHAEGQGVKVSLMASLTLNDEGECRLLVGAEQLDRWQFLRRSLEPLLFKSEDL